MATSTPLNPRADSYVPYGAGAGAGPPGRFQQGGNNGCSPPPVQPLGQHDLPKHPNQQQQQQQPQHQPHVQPWPQSHQHQPPHRQYQQTISPHQASQLPQSYQHQPYPQTQQQHHYLHHHYRPPFPQQQQLEPRQPYQHQYQYQQSPLLPASCARATSSTSPPYPPTPQVDCTLITTVEEVAALVKKLSTETLIAMDCEGCDLSKGSWRRGERLEDPKIPLHGQLCLIQLGTQNGEAYAIDVHRMGESAFDGGLRELLTNPKILKAVHDFRQDEDALFHQFNVVVQAKFDCQLADVLIRRLQNYRTTYVSGCAKLFQQNGIQGLSQEEKGSAHERFSQDRHLWSRRPLPDDMVRYAKYDVLPLVALVREQMTVLKGLLDAREASALMRKGSDCYDSLFRNLEECRCRLCCDAAESAKFDGCKVFGMMQKEPDLRNISPSTWARIRRPEDNELLAPPGKSKYFVDEHDQSVKLPC